MAAFSRHYSISNVLIETANWRKCLQLHLCYKCTCFKFQSVHWCICMLALAANIHCCAQKKMQKSIWNFVFISWTGIFMQYWQSNSLSIWYCTFLIFTHQLGQKIQHLCSPICNFSVSKVALSIRHCEWDWNGHGVFCRTWCETEKHT